MFIVLDFIIFKLFMSVLFVLSRLLSVFERMLNLGIILVCVYRVCRVGRVVA